jgi:hypothetical protein
MLQFRSLTVSERRRRNAPILEQDYRKEKTTEISRLERTPSIKSIKHVAAIRKCETNAAAQKKRRPKLKGKKTATPVALEQKNESPITEIIRQVSEEQARTGKNAKIVRIAPHIASGLVGMSAEDWHNSSNGFTDMSECRRIAEDFKKRDIAAVNGFRLWLNGPVLRLATDSNAPDIEIIE